MKIKSVQISGMHNVEARTYDFNDIAYLFGRNGAGKSTVMQAIQLAILGYIPGTDKTNTAIFRHANCDMMSVSVEFDNGQKVTRLFKKSGNSVKVTVLPDNFRPEHILGELELPVFNFNEFASMTANKL
ncbi:MAG: AAA family ATPase, partial [Clostridia bacterium]|nr:AAA family ATPase [Clostridia bacterium]